MPAVRESNRVRPVELVEACGLLRSRDVFLFSRDLGARRAERQIVTISGLAARVLEFTLPMPRTSSAFPSDGYGARTAGSRFDAPTSFHGPAAQLPPQTQVSVGFPGSVTEPGLVLTRRASIYGRALRI